MDQRSTHPDGRGRAARYPKSIAMPPLDPRKRSYENRDQVTSGEQTFFIDKQTSSMKLDTFPQPTPAPITHYRGYGEDRTKSTH